ncbi:MGH1-like glycoside hydrolase domain-containing protein [Christiangramia portivictoriae]|uniref:MGH1-like glycoside hydrolase domain-containing protein n=1 Tax=Christiangramia portivictoriae TaxID=326069 RepID=UPI000A02FFA5|nr:trehalase family glycosidase [Christiangramia portivictoriae]
MNRYLLLCFYLFISTFFMVAQKNHNRSAKKEIYNLLDYRGTPDSPEDKSFLIFSDKGSWFGFSTPSAINQDGFSGPFIMSQNNGTWLSPSLVNIRIKSLMEANQKTLIRNSYEGRLSGLNFKKETKNWQISHSMFFVSAKTAVFKFQIKNFDDKPISIQPVIEGKIFEAGFSLEQEKKLIKVKSKTNNFYGLLNLPTEVKLSSIVISDTSYSADLNPIEVASGATHEFIYSFSFATEFDKNELDLINTIQGHFYQEHKKIQQEKLALIGSIQNLMQDQWKDSTYYQLAQKSLLTLQNNWRAASGGLKYDGFFPSYHYKWFYGFWAWDSWKHAVAVAYYDPDLAKSQVLAMYDYQTENGFIPDCVYRDNVIEENNYRNTKPPLSAWAAWTIFKQDGDRDFIKKIYPKIKKQHEWWYLYRDHDKDGICEYGSTDGTLIAAKWESGMDNAVRFDDTKLLPNSKNAFSMDQESVDLNSFLYAEKLYLKKLAKILKIKKDEDLFEKQADILREQINHQFYNEEDGWYYDTSLDGNSFIKIKGSEGWIPLWAGIASKSKANNLLKIMMDSTQFNTSVPLQTLNASSEKFEPDGGYWRGPTWIDQSYFGIKGLKKYGYESEANELTRKLIHNAEGVTKNGKAIRENYNPISGKGLEAYNFSWSAAHYLLLLLNE